MPWNVIVPVVGQVCCVPQLITWLRTQWGDLTKEGVEFKGYVYQKKEKEEEEEKEIYTTYLRGRYLPR
jgi:hypothetical protein